MTAKHEVPEWIKLLRRDLAALPSDYAICYPEVVKRRHEFLSEISRFLEGPLNSHLQTLPHANLAEKREIATMVNRDLRQLNLCVRCAQTKMPAILVADFSGHSDWSSRFRYETLAESGRKLKKPASRSVPLLELQEAPQRIEGLAGRGRSSGRE